MLKKFLRSGGVVFLCAIILVGFWFLLKGWRIKKANQYLKKGDLLSYAKAATLLPFSPLTHLRLGEAYLNAGDLRKAQKELKTILWICRCFAWKNKNLVSCPEYKQGYQQLKKIEIIHSLQNNEIKKAEAASAEAIELNPQDHEVRFYLGEIFLSRGDLKEALLFLHYPLPNKKLEEERKNLLEPFKKGIDFSNPRLFILLGISFLKNGQPFLAAKEFEKAIEMDNQYRDAWLWLGKTYLFLAEKEKSKVKKTKFLTEAKQSLEKAAEIDPVYPETANLLSRIYLDLNQPDSASKEKERLQILQPREVSE